MLHCEAEKRDGELIVRWTFSNTTEGEVWIFDRVYRSAGTAFALQPGFAYVTSPAPGIVEIAKRLVAVPEEIDVESPEVPGVTRLAPGARAQGTMRTPWPPKQRTPYSDEEPIEQIERVTCAVGWMAAGDDAQLETTETDAGEVRHPRYTEELAAQQKVATVSLSI